MSLLSLAEQRSAQATNVVIKWEKTMKSKRMDSPLNGHALAITVHAGRIRHAEPCIPTRYPTNHMRWLLAACGACGAYVYICCETAGSAR